MVAGLRWIGVLGLVGVLWGTAASAYDSWQGEQQDGTAGESKLLAELRSMVEQARRDRAAAPAFLSDLEALIRRHTDSWPRAVVSDSFTDGDFERNPAWSVLSGSWDVTRDGLHSRTTVSKVAGKAGNEQEMAMQLLGALLGNQKPLDPTAPQKSVSEASIALPEKLPNTIALDLDFKSLGSGGALELSFYQGSGRIGYRLRLQPDSTPTISLYRVGRSGTVMLADHGASLKAGALERLRWTRDAQGQMQVSVNDTVVLTASDKSFSDRWDGLLVRNDGGDFALASVRLSGP